MVYEKKIRPSDVYGVNAEKKINGLLKREFYYVTRFRPPELGDHFVAPDGTEILGCCAARTFEPRIIVASRNEPLDGLWE